MKKPRRRFIWSPERDENLRRMWFAGKYVLEIGAHFDCSHSTIIDRCVALGLPARSSRRRNADEIMTARRRYNSARPRKLKVAPAPRDDERKSPKGNGSWPEERKQKLCVLWADKRLAASVIGKRLGVTKNAVLRKAKRMGLPSRRPPSNARSSHPTPIHATLPAPRLELLNVGPANTCQFIAGVGRPWATCGAPSVFNHSWCADHMRIVYG